MSRYVALLRGINLGKRMRMEVRAPREALTGIGLADATTYLQSDNAMSDRGPTARVRSPSQLQKIVIVCQEPPYKVVPDTQ